MHQTYKNDDDDQLDYTFDGDDENDGQFYEWENPDEELSGYEEYDRYEDPDLSEEE